MPAAFSRGCRRMASIIDRTPSTLGSPVPCSMTRPRCMALSMMINVPGLDSAVAYSRYVGHCSRSASMKTRSNGGTPMALSVSSEWAAGPTTISTVVPQPARSMFSRASRARSGSISSVTSEPPGTSPLASQIVLKPASVPISRMRRAPIARASTSSIRPCAGETAIRGRPARSADICAASRASSCGDSHCSSARSTASHVGCCGLMGFMQAVSRTAGRRAWRGARLHRSWDCHGPSPSRIRLSE